MYNNEEDYGSDRTEADSDNNYNVLSLEEEGEDDNNEETKVFELNKSEEEAAAPIYLTCEEAARCLCMLGKNDSGLKYSYLMMNASEKNLTDISVIPTFRNVLFVDLSGNRLTQSSLKVLLSMTYLLMIKADRNQIESAEMEPAMLYLQVLSLNRNEISNTSGISHRLLECLELNYNKITAVNLNPYKLENIKVLEIRGNLLRTTNGIFFPTLVSLYIADNKIERIEGFETLVNLKTLHARNNEISILDGLDNPKCVKLNYINLRENRIARFSEFKKLRDLPALEILIISENPLTAISTEKDDEKDEDDDEIDEYRIKLIALIPHLKRINKDPVLDDERYEAKELTKRMIQEGTSLSETDEEIENE